MITILAQRTTKCSECNEYIVARRDDIRKLYDGGTVWVHVRCHIKYWDEISHQMTLDDRLAEEADRKNDDIWLQKRGLID